MTEHSCPDAVIVAAFAEGTLPPWQRAEVERHVANCPECPAVIGEVTRFLTNEAAVEAAAEPPPSPGRWWLIAAAVAALCIPVALWRTMANRDPMARLRSIAAASSERYYEGRLHDFPHTRFRSPRSDEKTAIPIALRNETERLAERGNDADVLHARGVAALLSGDPNEAARLLRASTRATPDDPAIWTDLAAAELARATLGNRTALTAALDAVRNATTLAPTSSAAHYNLALTLEHLGHHREAIGAYRQAFALEPSSPWRIEIEERLQRLESGN